MSVTNPFAPVVAIDRRQGTNDSRRKDDRSALGEPVAVEQLIAHVFGRAHETVAPLRDPSEARTILRVAHLFADDLAKMDPRFNRLRFIQAITRDPA